jgi:trk system potassium uptake protein TrkH
MRLSLVVHITGQLVRLFGAALVVPLVVAALYRETGDMAGFLVALIVGVAVGYGMRAAGGRRAEAAVESLRRIEGMAIVSLTWMVVAILAAVPYVWVGVPFVDALFESMSGLTTTGATIFTDFEAYGRAVFLWRALTHWIGGLGVIALFVAVLPRLAIGGRQLFFAEAAGPTEDQLTPQLRQTAIALWRLYGGLTALQTTALVLAGMPLYDAVCHAMATLAAGGFSPHAQSIAGYDSAVIDWIVTAFMFAAGANFVLQYRSLRMGHGAFRKDEEFRAYAGIVAVATLVVTGVLLSDGMGFGDALRHGAFQVISIVTTTGFASVDFELWSDQAKVTLLLLMFVGGCAGSAGGGPKVVRHVLMARYTLRELKRAVHPRAVLPVKLGGRVVPEDIMRDILVFMLFYLLTFAIGATIVTALGTTLLEGITASAACLGNVGPGFGSIGPMGSYAHLHPISKIVLTLEMWIGRLEVLTVLVFFRWEAWRASRWQINEGRRDGGLTL